MKSDSDGAFTVSIVGAVVAGIVAGGAASLFIPDTKESHVRKCMKPIAWAANSYQWSYSGPANEREIALDRAHRIIAEWPDCFTKEARDGVKFGIINE